jgi:GDP-L-fucose synthase
MYKKNIIKPKMLICGATGFIGRNMIEYFAKKNQYDIRAIHFSRPKFDIENSKSEIEWLNGDLRDSEFVTEIMKDIDIVVQCAATTSGSKDIVNTPYLHVTDNALMNSILLKSAYDQKIKHFIFFSCTVMYPSSEKAISESDFDYNSPIHDRYFGVGNTKIYIEKMLEFYSNISNMKTTAIRHSNIYGPHDKYDFERSHVFGATVSKVLLASDKVTVWGEGEEARDLLYVDDLNNFIALIIEKQSENFELFNCGGGSAIKIKDLVNKIIKLSGKQLIIEHDLSMPSIPTSLFVNCDKAKQKLGWVPQVDLEHGIIKTLAWWQDNIDPKTLKIKET